MTPSRLFRIGFVVLGISLAALVVRARQAHTVYGAGTISCGTWLSQKTERGLALDNVTWVQGFITGVGSAGKRLKKTDKEGMAVWIDQFCTKNPLKQLVDAAEELSTALEIK